MNSEDLSDHSDEEDWMDTNWLNEEMSSVSTESSKTLKSPNNCSGTQHIQGLFPPAKNNEDACTTKLEKKMDDSLMSRMRLNDNKAGMEGLDKEKINQIILEASKGSKFYENERKKEEQVRKRIQEQQEKHEKITETQLSQGLIQADMLLEEFERARDLSRTIVHIDMDAFYAAVEIRDKPSLKDKPMAVGSSSMLSTSNYHARKYGVRAAMPGFIGKKLCPDLIIVPQNFEKYTSVSKQVKNILAEYDPNFCPMSLDEAYLDITDHLQKRQMMSEEDRSYLCRKCDNLDTKQCLCDLNEVIKQPMCMKKSSNLLQEGKKKGLDEYRSDQEADEKSLKCLENTKICPVCGKPFPDYEAVVFGSSPDDTVHEMRSRIEQKTRLTASAGIAPNMMLSKVCSDKNKPNGQYRIQPTVECVMDFIKDLPIRKISGIGKVTEQMLNAVGVVTCTDLYNKRALLYHLYSQISFNYFMRICLGIGSTTVERDSERKSISTERTFSEISNPSDLYSKCNELCEALSNDLEEEQLKGKTVTIKLKTVKFEVKTRAHTLPEYTSDVEVIFATAKDLLKTEIQHVSPNPLRLRLMGVRMSSLLHQSLCKSKQKQRTLSGIVKKMVNKSTSNRTLTGIGMIQDTQTAEKITQNEFTNGETLTGLDNVEQNDCIKFSESRATRMCSNKSDSETYTEKMSCSSTSTTSIMAKELNKCKSCDNNREENIASQNPLLMTANGHEISNMEVCRNIDTIMPGFQKGSDFQDSLDTPSTLESVPYSHSNGETVHSVLAGPKNKGAKDAEIGMNYDDTLAKCENENLECARKPIDSPCSVDKGKTKMQYDKTCNSLELGNLNPVLITKSFNNASTELTDRETQIDTEFINYKNGSNNLGEITTRKDLEREQGTSRETSHTPLWSDEKAIISSLETEHFRPVGKPKNYERSVYSESMSQVKQRTDRANQMEQITYTASQTEHQMNTVSRMEHQTDSASQMETRTNTESQMEQRTDIPDTEMENVYECPVCRNDVKCDNLSDLNQHIDICLNKKIVMDCSRNENLQANLNQNAKFIVHKKSPIVSKKSPIVSKKSPSLSKKSKIRSNQMKSPKSLVSKNSDKSLTPSKFVKSPESLPSKSISSKLVSSPAFEDMSQNKQCDGKNESQITNDNFNFNKNEVPTAYLDFNCNSTNSALSADKNSSHTSTSDQGRNTGQEMTITKLICPVCFMEQSGSSLDEFNCHMDTCLSKGAISDILKEQKTDEEKLLGKRSYIDTQEKLKGGKRKRSNSGQTPRNNRQNKMRSIDLFFKA